MDIRFSSVLLLALTLSAAADPLADSAQRKLDSIQNGRARPGSTITFTPAEVNAWAHVNIPQVVPQGIRNGRVELAADTATGYALVDFLKMRQAKGQETGRLFSKLIEGERPLKVVLRVTSRNGFCTVTPVRVELSNAVASGFLLEFLIKTFFLPLYPDARIGEPFELGYNMERIAVHAGGISVVMKK
jgi:hypothetical protein